MQCISPSSTDKNVEIVRSDTWPGFELRYLDLWVWIYNGFANFVYVKKKTIIVRRSELGTKESMRFLLDIICRSATETSTEEVLGKLENAIAGIPW